MRNDKVSNEEKWNEFGGFSPLISLFNKIKPVSDEIQTIINRETFPVRIKKYKYLLSPIDRNKNLFYIVRGVVRGYIKDEQKEITTWISAENNVVGSIRNLWKNEASDEYLQALEDIEAIVIPHNMSEYLYANFADANFIGRVMIENYYRSAEERAYICRISSAEKRYRHYLNIYPELVDRISLKYVASFLGIRLETLSRIRTMGKSKRDPDNPDSQ